MSQCHKPACRTGRVKKNNELKTVLKFDTGADGFQMMIYVLIVFAVCLLSFGMYFLMTTFNHSRI